MPVPFRLTLFLGAALTAPGPLAGQRALTATATLTIGTFGRATVSSPLRRGALAGPGARWVTGAVATIHVGPYVLQARLVGDRPETILVRDPETHAMARLTAGDWVAIATGPGGKNILNPVAFLVVGKPGSGEGILAEAEQLAVAYRVVPRLRGSAPP